ncbi:hypothetical protein [Massilia sp. YIM B02443]|uniref:hypothetical protein n=1 Tax=Massilia sp. YIM B02443 TaxID=3050127 RepID=UPI0025B68F9E|nr:hypothetical protein [Massilia sp. YIM B02443]MDN4037716.1 hypothetical protein [Massilia sp. YIM B02443]
MIEQFSHAMRSKNHLQHGPKEKNRDDGRRAIPLRRTGLPVFARIRASRLNTITHIAGWRERIFSSLLSVVLLVGALSTN